MSLDHALQQCAVLGAAGKMGRGISLLLLQEMALLEAVYCGKTGTGSYELVLVDIDSTGFPDLRRYLRQHLLRYAERNLVQIREAYANQADLVSNGEIIASFIEGAMDNVVCTTVLEEAAAAHLVFEALPEDFNFKSQSLNKLKQAAPHPQFYLTNTSSIPIDMLSKLGDLNGHIIGFHFYNPPAIQKLLELCIPDKTDAQLKAWGPELAKRLGKTSVLSRDYPGFIGNGMFIQEIAFAGNLIERLTPVFELPHAIYIVDYITREYLVRPMGIFQLIDFVGVDICYRIAETIAAFTDQQEVLSPLMKEFFISKIRGGVTMEGTQKDGIFKYGPKNQQTAVFDLRTNTYLPLNDESCKRAMGLLGSMPEGHITWKEAHKLFKPENAIKPFLQVIASSNTAGSQLAMEYLHATNMIAKLILSLKIAESPQDIATVLKLGFQHLYSPLDEWVEHIIAKEVTL